MRRRGPGILFRLRISVLHLVAKIQALYDQRGAGLLGPEGEVPADLAKTGVEHPGRCLVVEGKNAGSLQVAVQVDAACREMAFITDFRGNYLVT
jgi:hypothetical protein